MYHVRQLVKNGRVTKAPSDISPLCSQVYAINAKITAFLKYQGSKELMLVVLSEKAC